MGVDKIKLNLKTALSTFARKSPLISNFLDFFPLKTKFYDSQKRVVSRSINRLFQLWRCSDQGESAAVYNAYAGGDVIDIGSYNGFYSLLLAPKGNPGDIFISCEPDPTALPMLFHSLQTASYLFPHLKFFGFPFPMGDGSPAVISYPLRTDAHPQYLSQCALKDGVPSYTVDSLVLLMNLKPVFVKIDVEGAEYEVLRGMEKTFAAHHPLVMLEIHPQWQPPNVDVSQVEKIMSNYGYVSQEITRDLTAVRQLWRFQGDTRSNGTG